MSVKKIFIVLVATLLLASCANRGIGPQGGPKDSIPPIALRSEPELGMLNFQGKRIEVTFNEYLQLNDLASNLIMSPPQQTPPDVKARGKRLIVQFQDSLRDSTTYTIDFGDAVCDYTEKNPLHGFSFYFSTGDEIDTLETYGRVFDASNMNPLKGIFVGIHNDMADSAFTKKPFLRIARTDSAGGFRIGNVHPGTYRLYAVDDVSRDYRLTPGEAIAFYDEPIVVSAQQNAPLTDSLRAVLRDSIDSISAIRIPQSTLFLFKEEQQRLYLQRTLRDKRHLITLLFSSPPDSLPHFHPLTDSLNYHIQYSSHRDTVTIWLLDSMSIEQDSLFIETRYRRTDSVYHLEWYTDTLRAIWRAPRLSAKALEAQAREIQNRRLDLKTNARRGFDLYDTLRLSCSTPLATIERDSIRLMERIDTLLQPVPFTLLPYDTLTMTLSFIAQWKEGARYQLQLDSGTLHDVYGFTHIRANYDMEVKSLSDYSTLRIRLMPFNPKARIQLLDKQDNVVREMKAKEDGALFEYLKPDTYYMRLYIDENGDGKWTTGEWATKRQPEPIYYYSDKIQTKSNWDFEQEWDYTAVPRINTKPAELIKASSKKK